MIPGEILASKGELELNKGRNPITIEVANTGDRPIQVGSGCAVKSLGCRPLRPCVSASSKASRPGPTAVVAV